MSFLLTIKSLVGKQFFFIFSDFQFFTSEERIKSMRKMILAVTPEQRKVALNALLPFQRSDFEGIFRAMDGNC